MGRRRGGAWSVLGLLLAAATGCTAAELPVRACTQIGSPAGLAVTVEQAAVVAGMQLTLRICQQDCIEAPVELSPGSVSVGETCASADPDAACSASASPDGTRVGFVDLATLAAGSVRVSGRLRTGSTTARLEEVTVTAEPTYPNGRQCPAGGPQAAVHVTTAGLR